MLGKASSYLAPFNNQRKDIMKPGKLLLELGRQTDEFEWPFEPHHTYHDTMVVLINHALTRMIGLRDEMESLFNIRDKIVESVRLHHDAALFVFQSDVYEYLYSSRGEPRGEAIAGRTYSVMLAQWRSKKVDNWKYKYGVLELRHLFSVIASTQVKRHSLNELLQHCTFDVVSRQLPSRHFSVERSFTFSFYWNKKDGRESYWQIPKQIACVKAHLTLQWCNGFGVSWYKPTILELPI